MIRVAIFDDNQSLRIGLYQLINGTEGFACVGAYENCKYVLRDIKDCNPDIVLMDIAMPGIDGIEAVRMIRQQYPTLKILMQTVFQDDVKIFHSILAGANGYILKNSSALRILESIKEIYEGGAPMSPSVATRVLQMVSNPIQVNTTTKFDLTERELEILRLLVKGRSYKVLASECDISIDTVRTHIKNIYEKLQVHSMTDAVLTAIRQNIVQL
jgi:DNA-binding NarL/FixJ family response regulator